MKIKFIFWMCLMMLMSSSLHCNERKRMDGAELKNHPWVLEVAQLRAQETQQRCMRFVQMNIFEFEECVSEILNHKKLSPPERLGVTYMGFIGALSAQRMGSQGSQMMAWKYGNAFHKLQKQLKLEDKQVCEIVAGDCESRIARTQLILKGPPPKPLTEIEMADRHNHKH